MVINTATAERYKCSAVTFSIENLLRKDYHFFYSVITKFFEKLFIVTVLLYISVILRIVSTDLAPKSIPLAAKPEVQLILKKGI